MSGDNPWMVQGVRASRQSVSTKGARRYPWLMRARLVLAVGFALATACSGGAPSRVKGAPKTPPDDAYETDGVRTNRVLVWNCTPEHERVVMQQPCGEGGCDGWTLDARRALGARRPSRRASRRGAGTQSRPASGGADSRRGQFSGMRSRSRPGRAGSRGCSPSRRCGELPDGAEEVVLEEPDDRRVLHRHVRNGALLARTGRWRAWARACRREPACLVVLSSSAAARRGRRSRRPRPM